MSGQYNHMLFIPSRHDLSVYPVAMAILYTCTHCNLIPYLSQILYTKAIDTGKSFYFENLNNRADKILHDCAAITQFSSAVILAVRSL